MFTRSNFFDFIILFFSFNLKGETGCQWLLCSGDKINPVQLRISLDFKWAFHYGFSLWCILKDLCLNNIQ